MTDQASPRYEIVNARLRPDDVKVVEALTEHLKEQGHVLNRSDLVRWALRKAAIAEQLNIA